MSEILRRKGFTIIHGGKDDPPEVVIRTFWKDCISKQYAADRANMAEGQAREEFDLANEYLESIASDEMIPERCKRAAESDVALYRESVRKATAIRLSAETAHQRADKAFSDKMLAIARIPKCWHNDADVEFLDNNDGTACIRYGNTSNPEATDWDGELVVYATGEIEHISIPKDAISQPG